MLQVHSHARKRQQGGKNEEKKNVYMAEKSSECKKMGEGSQKEAANALPAKTGYAYVCENLLSLCVSVCMCVSVCAGKDNRRQCTQARM